MRYRSAESFPACFKAVAPLIAQQCYLKYKLMLSLFVLLVYIENCRLEVTSYLHQNLLKLGEIVTGIFKMLKLFSSLHCAFRRITL